MTGVEKLARLKHLLLGMERDLGMDGLSTVQRDIVYAATLLSETSRTLTTENLRQHELLDDVSRSAFFRALKELVENGYLRHTDGRQRSAYILSDKLRN
ncbi:hypothetical protein [Yoonia sediminilitoris]|uniref:MarR family protein n=1 Tax=Yoonia sediminilitoris TaxID=1286148 RepID=A0A2T6KDG5_9RHOB|nr:hypothetical protein [Yoonia sediminilitoris]PUB13094.1 hypothetical protein C8N45_10814 [Yoonia sediminilitoris]RCW94431.1 hypothetical protein DFP92_10817 [Yoonia sediminilitoris]